jgi:hypothetical protein
MLRASLLLSVFVLACSDREPRMPSARVPDYSSVALEFATALASRDYPAAYAMTSREYQRSTTLDEMRAAFEAIVPTDWPTVGPVEVGQVMESWPARQPSDVGWVYVSIGGDGYSEAVTVVVMRQADRLKIRTVEFGRP